MEVSPTNAWHSFIMQHSWLQLLMKKSYVITLSIFPLSNNFWTNFNQIGKPGRHLTDMSFYHLNEN